MQSGLLFLYPAARFWRWRDFPDGRGNPDQGISLPRFAQPLAKLGDSSYALYLLHPFIFRAFLVASGGITWPQEWKNVVYLIVVASTIAIAHAFHVLVETPANIWLRDRLITPRRKVAVS